MSKHTLEQVLEALLNKEEDRASELLHQFFVAKGKSIYEELSALDQQLEEEELDEEEVDEAFGGSPAQDFEDEIVADETELEDESLFAEADDEPEDAMAADVPSEPEATADLAMGDEPAGDDMGGEEGAEGEAEEALTKVEDALADLKAAFAEIMGEPAPEEGAPEGEEETEEAFDPLGESASLTAVAAPTHGDNGQNTKSPVSSGPKISDNGAKPVKTNSGTVSAGTEGGLAKPSANAINSGNVNVPGNKKAPALKSVATPKNSDSASNKTSPVAK